MSKRVEIALLALICSLFFILASYNIELPGLYYDEALDVVPTMQLVTGQHVEEHRSIEILGHRLPIMVSEYVGPVSTYLTLPFFLLFGVSVFSLRLVTIFFAVGTITFTFYFLKLLFNRKVAFWAALLLAVNPAFIMCQGRATMSPLLCPSWPLVVYTASTFGTKSGKMSAFMLDRFC